MTRKASHTFCKLCRDCVQLSVLIPLQTAGKQVRETGFGVVWERAANRRYGQLSWIMSSSRNSRSVECVLEVKGEAAKARCSSLSLSRSERRTNGWVQSVVEIIANFISQHESPSRNVQRYKWEKGGVNSNRLTVNPQPALTE